MIHPSTVFLNGKFISHDHAFISPDDRGFYFADGVYEVIKYYKGKPFYFQEHIMRLENSLRELHINYRGSEKLSDICSSLIAANHLKQTYAGVYIQITRGTASRTHRFPAGDIQPTIYIRAFVMQTCMNEFIEGVSVMTREDIRWLKCNVKSIALLPNTLLFEEVAEKGAFECMLVRNGNVTEATHSNMFAVKNGNVQTHPDSNLVLPGVTKKAVFDICRQNSIRVIEEPIKADKIGDYEEWFLTGTGSEIVPVVRIDDHIVNKGKPGPVTRAIQHAFLKATYEELAGEKLRLG